nr:hypothetical protein [Candidatus Sigynarchaeota archaeon]
MAKNDAASNCVITTDDEHGLAYKNTIDQWPSLRGIFVMMLVMALVLACIGMVALVSGVQYFGDFTDPSLNIWYWVGIFFPAFLIVWDVILLRFYTIMTFTVDFNKDRGMLLYELGYLQRSTREPIRWMCRVKEWPLSSVTAIFTTGNLAIPFGKRTLHAIIARIEGKGLPVHLYQAWSLEDAETMRGKIAAFLWGDPGYHEARFAKK